jgi:hypothetical protein
MKRNPFQDTILLFHSACGGEDGIASFKLPNGEEVHWRLRPYSLTQIAAVDLFMRGGRRTIDLTPGRDIAILPFLRCFGPKIPDAQALRAVFHILRHPRIQRQAVKFYSRPFVTSMDEAARAIARRLGARGRRPARPAASLPAARVPDVKPKAPPPAQRVC